MPNKKRGTEKKRGTDIQAWRSNQPQAQPGKLRIVGGKFRGRQLDYSGDPRTRPMKDNIREALFNLIGGWIQGKHAFDLFAGTGAIGLEALSRGACHITLIERHFPTAKVLRDNIQYLQVEQETTIETANSFFWGRQFLAKPDQFPGQPWAVFCSPPYHFFKSRWSELHDLLNGLLQAAPPESLFVVESNELFDTTQLPQANRWNTRQYSPAQISVLRPGSGSANS